MFESDDFENLLLFLCNKFALLKFSKLYYGDAQQEIGNDDFSVHLKRLSPNERRDGSKINRL